MSGYDADEMMGWIEAIVAHGPRRPGSDAGRAVEDYLARELERFGFASVRREPIAITAWDEGDASLIVEHDGFAPEVSAVPHAAPTPASGVEGPLLFVDPDRLPARERWQGAIVVAEIGFPRLDTRLLLRIAPGKHDPDGTLPLVDHPATWVRLGWHLYREAARRGAAGFVGILTDQPGGSCRMYAPYGFREADILDKPIPGVWIGRDDGARLRRQIAGSSITARLTVRGSRREALTHNVVAERPGQGRDDEVIVLSCHHDSPFASPVEDASGCAVVLALARRFAAGERLRRRLVVLFTAGHFHGSIGTKTFIRQHRDDLVRRTALEVSIEHIAREAIEGPGGGLIPTGRPEATAIFVPFARTIAAAVLEGMAEQSVDRVVLLPAEGPLGSYPPTDGGDWFEAGVPVINCISNPVYLLTDDDATRWVDRERLPRVAAAFEQIIRRLDREDRRTLAATSSWPYRLAMKGLRAAAWAKATRFGTRPLY
jgi:hypothetical protein